MYKYVIDTVIGELVVQHHPTVGRGRTAVSEGRLDAVVDLIAGNVGRQGEHVDGQDAQAVLLPRMGSGIEVCGEIQNRVKTRTRKHREYL